MAREGDIDQLLLQQFSCMGTTDKDELVKQLQAIVGYSLNSRTAQFYLEMNNWNLQGAVGSYFDTDTSFNLPSMMLIRNHPSVIDDETIVHPRTPFYKIYEVQNTGTEPWPGGCFLLCTDGLLMRDEGTIPVVCLLPGCRTTIRIDMVAPELPGDYHSKWRMSTREGLFFGDVIWVIVSVCDQTLNGLTDQMSSLGTRLDEMTQLDSTLSNENGSTNMDEDGNMHC